MKKRVLSLLMSFVLLITLLPATTRAAEDTITVQMTVYNQGQLAKDKDDKAMLLRSVTVSDLDSDGKYTLDEALQAAHAAYCPNGYETTASDWGLSVTKLWGTETISTGFYKNDQMTEGVGSETVSNGDRITAFIYYDQTGYSDRYAFFDKQSLTAAVGEEFELTLSWSGCDEYWSTVTGAAVIGAPLGVFDAESGAYAASDKLKGEHIFGEIYSNAATGLDGKVKCSFTQAGIYYLTAEYNASGYSFYNDDMSVRYNYLVPPLCVVTVLSAEDYANYQVVQDAKKQLTWESMSSEPQTAVTVAPDLLSELTVDGKTVSVSWESTDNALSVSDYYGPWSAYVDRPAAQDATDNLTATLTYTPEGEDATPVTDTVVFAVTVKAEGVSEDKQTVVSFKTLMDNIAASYTSSTDAWTVLDMAGYGTNIKGDNYGYSSAAPSQLAESAIGGKTSYLDELKSLEELTIYNTPYVLLAYDAAEVDEDETFTNTRAGMKSTLVKYLNALTDYTGVDEVTPILAALAPYYGKDDSDLDAAVNAGIAWLSKQQNSDGTFSYYGTSNAESTALAVVALSALGIDAHRDLRFIKDGHSALEGLMSFARSSQDGFGHKGNVTKNEYATEQSFRALVSYARFAENGGKAYNIYLDAQVGKEAPADPKIATTVKPAPIAPSGDESITVRITVSGDTGVWLKTSVSAKSGVSVYDVLTSVLTANGYTWTGSSHYISYITHPDGTKLGEFSTGDNSGWLYKVNGSLPSDPIGEYTLDSNSSVVVYYTNDWTLDPDASSMGGALTVAQRREANAVSALIAALGTITVDSGDDIAAARAAYDALSAMQKKLVTNLSVLEKAEADYAALTAFTLTFADVAETAWYYDAVRFVCEKGLMTGASAETFLPDDTATRAQVVTILWRLAGCPVVDYLMQYPDVAEDAWYAEAVRWATSEGIVTGYLDGSFAPDDTVTREQLAAMLYRFVQKQGGGFTGSWYFLLRFDDAGEIGAWANEAMHWCVMKKLLNGTSGTMLSPRDSATRAQLAAILQRFDALSIDTAENTSTAQSAYDAAAAYLAETVSAPTVSSIGGEWTVLALTRGGADFDEAAYLTALEKALQESGGVLSTRKYTEYSRVILALTALGKDARSFAGYDLTLPLGDFEKTVAQGVNGAIFALLALDSGDYPMPQNDTASVPATRQMYLDFILNAQRSDGGWSLKSDGEADADLTAMALAALAPYRTQSAVQTAVDAALARLSAMQSADGGFSSSGVANAESCAQVLLALCALDIDPTDARFVKNSHTAIDALLSYQTASGGFRHTASGAVNLMASEQATCALAALVRAERGETSFYAMLPLALRAAA